MPIDHFCILVNASKWEETLKFYNAIFPTFGYKKLASYQDDGVLGYGKDVADFWMTRIPDDKNAGDGTHFAFSLENRKQVDEYHAAGLENGGKDNGKPGIRFYHPNYYAAFLHDPAGNNVEVVCHIPE